MSRRRSVLRRPGMLIKGMVICVTLLAAGCFVLIGGKGIPHRTVRDIVSTHPLGARGAQVVQGTARVVDGDTLEIGTDRIRLYGIDTPEHGQTCLVDGSKTKIGHLAAHHLSQLTMGRRIICFVVDHDRYGRLVSVCEADEVELNYAMVRDGWARAYIQYSRNYVPAENRARQGDQGLWACNRPIEPWVYRRQKRQ